MANKGFIKFNGEYLPFPKYQMKVERQQFVDSTRNANGVVVASKINRRMVKLNITFPHLTAKEWGNILNMIEGFKGEVTFYDPLYQKVTTREMYWGDSSEVIFKLDDKNLNVIEYIDCTCNLIDIGGAVR